MHRASFLFFIGFTATLSQIGVKTISSYGKLVGEEHQQGTKYLTLPLLVIP
jgi:hypothetical protein